MARGLVNVPTRVGNGIDISDATATAADIVKDKIAYIASGKVTGTHECSGNTFMINTDSALSIIPAVLLYADYDSTLSKINCIQNYQDVTNLLTSSASAISF